MRLPGFITDGGTESESEHVECRDCGTNLTAEADACPECGGEVAVYSF